MKPFGETADEEAARVNAYFAADEPTKAKLRFEAERHIAKELNVASIVWRAEAAASQPLIPGYDEIEGQLEKGEVPNAPAQDIARVQAIIDQSKAPDGL